MSPKNDSEAEWRTRKKRIDPKLDAAGWSLWKRAGGATFRTEEEEAANGPADYALWHDGGIVGVVEAKKVTTGPQNVLTVRSCRHRIVAWKAGKREACHAARRTLCPVDLPLETAVVPACVSRRSSAS